MVDVSVDVGTADEACLALASAPVSFRLPGGGTMVITGAAEHKVAADPEHTGYALQPGEEIIRALPGRSTGVSGRRHGNPPAA